jgi:hypothetical protein
VPRAERPLAPDGGLLTEFATTLTTFAPEGWYPVISGTRTARALFVVDVVRRGQWPEVAQPGPHAGLGKSQRWR